MVVALATRLRPFMGQIGTSPSTTIPDSHNAGDFGSFLIGAPHRYALDAQELQRHKTDGHMDIDAVRASDSKTVGAAEHHIAKDHGPVFVTQHGKRIFG